MVKLTCRPMVTISDGKDVSAAVQVRFAHEDNSITIRAADSMVKDGFSTNGLSIGVAGGDRFDLVYQVDGHQPRVRLNSHVNVNDRRIGLVYRNAVAEGNSSLEASLNVDDNNTAAVVYDLSSYSGPNYRSATLKWTHRNGDLELTPSYNLGSEALSVNAKYNVDAENAVSATYNVNTNDAALQWTNSSGAGGGGDLRITARANLADANSAKQVPTLLIEKNWDLDV